MTFTYWLCTQVHRSDIVGELAQQVKRLDDWPATTDNLLAFRVYLARDSATPHAMRALLVAYDEWEQSKELPAVNVPVLLVRVGPLN